MMAIVTGVSDTHLLGNKNGLLSSIQIVDLSNNRKVWRKLAQITYTTHCSVLVFQGWFVYRKTHKYGCTDSPLIRSYNGIF